VKRGLDAALAAAGLAASSPLWLIIAVAIWLDGGRPIFFTQRRIGRDGLPFVAYKFRSMVTTAERTVRQAQPNDTRITRVGRVLRATAMDELPQLWNILRGDMSFVGPRPLAEREIESGADGHLVALQHIPMFRERHRVRPGLTGLTQVYAARDLPRRDKFRFDVLYVRRANLCLDVRLILLSVWISLHGRWEQRGPKV
jgi:lipopolysaccharide/colanic/teichoic acid biosynthesis glycosyltransferase